MLETAPAVIEIHGGSRPAGLRVIAECFSEDATFEDEARTHHGRRQIEE